MAIMYNIQMADTNMLDTTFLFQPRGPGTAYLFRMATPPVLIGRINPRTERPYGREIRERLAKGGIRNLKDALKQRDLLLGQIRAEERAALMEADGSMEQALEIAASHRKIDDAEQQWVHESALVDAAEELEKKIGETKASRWYKTAIGLQTPFAAVCEQYKADRGKALSKSTLNNLNTAIAEFREYAGADVCLEDVDRRMVAGFVTEFLPARKGPKAPDGQGPATIRKKCSQLSQVWRWAKQRGILPYAPGTPWDEQAPSKREIGAAAKKRRPFRPDETKKLLAAAPAGKALGDTIRVALLTGVRLEEVASLKASQVDPKATHYAITKGKSPNAARVVPLTSIARDVITKRLANVEDKDGRLFPEVRLRKSTEKYGGPISQQFTTLRRNELGAHTDGELVLHCFRHLWRTAARRAGVDERTSHELGGWAVSTASDVPYDHGLEIKQYAREQEKVARWLRKNGYYD